MVVSLPCQVGRWSLAVPLRAFAKRIFRHELRTGDVGNGRVLTLTEKNGQPFNGLPENTAFSCSLDRARIIPKINIKKRWDVHSLLAGRALGLWWGHALNRDRDGRRRAGNQSITEFLFFSFLKSVFYRLENVSSETGVRHTDNAAAPMLIYRPNRKTQRPAGGKHFIDTPYFFLIF